MANRSPALLAVALVFASLLPGASPVAGQSAVGFAPAGQTSFGQQNLQRVQTMLAPAPGAAGALDDYYFVAVGDIQNNVRSLTRHAFEAIAKDVRSVVDTRTGLPVYDQIRFVTLLGDLVYTGPTAMQWRNLEGTFAGEGLDRVLYPNIARLVADKPVLPVIGNHELLRFELKTQTKYRDLFDSVQGVNNFKRFFGWDRFIANPRILYPVPADLSSEGYRIVNERNADPEASRTLATQYTRGADGRYRLTFFEQPPLDPRAFSEGKARVVEALVPLFRKAGYGTLPALSSDNMIAYGVDAGGTILLYMDSMARGWHYPVFARLKKALYPNTKDQHRLNLFSESPFNGQADFYREVTALAKREGKSVVVLMHHSVINGSKSIHATGLGYNLWLALGMPQTPAEPGNATLFDKLLFTDADYLFSGCVHGYENFTVTASSPGREPHTLNWFVSGGGGGPLTRAFHGERFDDVQALYNLKRAAVSGLEPKGAIAITRNEDRLGHHYLLVHVQHGRIVDVSPRFIDVSTLGREQNRPQITLRSTFYSATSTGGGSVELTAGAWGMERIRRPLAFINWRPSVSLGMMRDSSQRTGTTSGIRTAVFEVSPLTLDVYIPGSKVVTLRPAGFELWAGPSGRRDYFMTFGVEAPIVFNIWHRIPALGVGLKAYVPLGSPHDSGRTGRAGIGVTLSYRITR
jgi:hypothetical protein